MKIKHNPVLFYKELQDPVQSNPAGASRGLCLLPSVPLSEKGVAFLTKSTLRNSGLPGSGSLSYPFTLEHLLSLSLLNRLEVSQGQKHF